MLKSLLPKESLNERETDSALRFLLIDGVCANIMTVLTTGVFLVSFALLMGASHKVIGLLAAIHPLSQILQIPTVYLVERVRHRKALTMFAAAASRLTYVIVALVPWLFPFEYRLPVLLAALMCHFGLQSMAGCAFNSWIRDVIPEIRMARFFASRMAWSAAVSASVSLAAGAALDFYGRHAGPDSAQALATGYTVMFGAAILAGLSGLYFLGRVGEPRMPVAENSGLRHLLAQPFKNENYRKLLVFIGTWNFTVNFVTPFFTVYLISRLQLNMTYVVGLTVLTQAANVLFFNIWARIADSHTNKSVIAVAAPMFFVTFLLWPLTDMPGMKFLMMPTLLVIHVLNGIAISGVTLCVTNLALRSAPAGKAASFVAVNALTMGLAAAVAPVTAGFCADYFENRKLVFTMSWFENLELAPVSTMPAITLQGLDFLFGMGLLLGVLAYYRIRAVVEPGEVKESVVRAQILRELRRVARQVSAIATMPLSFMPPPRIDRPAEKDGDPPAK